MMLLFCFSFDYLLKLFNFRLKMVQIILKVVVLYNCKSTIGCFLRISDRWQTWRFLQR